jgi:adenosine deaminase
MLPVAELHLHIEGTLEPELLVRLAARNGVRLPTTDVEELRARYLFTSLQSFLDLYYECMRVLRTEADFYDLAAAYLARAARAGVRRAEIFFDPQVHLGSGVPAGALFSGLAGAIKDADGVSAALIPCFLRDLGAGAAMETLTAMLPFRDQFIGVGLDSSETGNPPGLFADVYRRAAAEGLHLVAHAAEEGPPGYVHEALDVLRVERIDHGVRSMEDPDLVARLRDARVPLTVCPLSNVALKVVPDLGAHTLPRMLAAGLLVTVNSDDPAYFGGYVDDNIAAVRAEFGLSDEAVAGLARDSFDACFAPAEDKRQWQAEVDAWLVRLDVPDRVEELSHQRSAGRAAVAGGVHHQAGERHIAAEPD